VKQNEMATMRCLTGLAPSPWMRTLRSSAPVNAKALSLWGNGRLVRTRGYERGAQDQVRGLWGLRAESEKREVKGV